MTYMNGSMKSFLIIAALFLCTEGFAQYEHNILLSEGEMIVHNVIEIDSITFSNGNVPQMHLWLSNGVSQSLNLGQVDEVVFAGSPSPDPYPPGTVNCLPWGTAIVEVLNPVTGRIWMDRNLGAFQRATSKDDELSYGDLYQWGRFSDGHQCRNSSTTSGSSSTSFPEHDQFILPNGGTYFDWLFPNNNNLWQGISGLNNPCPSGFRIPTGGEWNAEKQSWSEESYEGAFGSELKLPAAGRRTTDGVLSNVNFAGYYWSSSPALLIPTSMSMYFNNQNGVLLQNGRASGFSVRCIKE